MHLPEETASTGLPSYPQRFHVSRIPRATSPRPTTKDGRNNGRLNGPAEDELRVRPIGIQQLDAMSLGHGLIELQRREHVPKRTSSDLQAVTAADGDHLSTAWCRRDHNRFDFNMLKSHRRADGRVHFRIPLDVTSLIAIRPRLMPASALCLEMPSLSVAETAQC